MSAPTAAASARVWPVLLAAPLVSALASLALGADLNYDLRHYHFYNGWALLERRLDHDLAPAGPQSYLNPLQDGLYYLGIRHLPAWLFGAVLGAVHGLNLVLVHRIALRVLGAGLPAFAATVLAGLGVNAVSLLGTTCGDTLVSLPALAALAVALEAATPRARLAAGALAGAAAGLKLTMLVPAGALGLTLLASGAKPRLRGLLAFAVGAALGFLALHGAWSWALFERFGNPVFPLANGVFRSPYYPPTNLFERRFAAAHGAEALVLPIQMAAGWTSRLQELRFREPRFLVLGLALLVWAAARARGAAPALAPAARMLLAFWLLAYLAWAYLLHYYRYAAVLELLAPAVILALLAPWRLGRSAAALAALVALSVFAGRPVNWGRVPWSGDWLGVTLPDAARTPRALVVLLGERVSYVAPFFPRETVFVGVTRRATRRFDPLLAAKIEAHQGPAFVIRGVGGDLDELLRFSLVPSGECARIETRDGGLELCPLARRAAGVLSSHGSARRHAAQAGEPLAEAERVGEVQQRLDGPEGEVFRRREGHGAQVAREERQLGEERGEKRSGPGPKRPSRGEHRQSR
jgi:hypothetical protein